MPSFFQTIQLGAFFNRKNTGFAVLQGGVVWHMAMLASQAFTGKCDGSETFHAFCSLSLTYHALREGSCLKSLLLILFLKTTHKPHSCSSTLSAELKAGITFLAVMGMLLPWFVPINDDGLEQSTKDNETNKTCP